MASPPVENIPFIWMRLLALIVTSPPFPPVVERPPLALTVVATISWLALRLMSPPLPPTFVGAVDWEPPAEVIVVMLIYPFPVVMLIPPPTPASEVPAVGPPLEEARAG